MNRFLVFAALFLAGCGSSGSANKLTTYKVSGKLTLGGTAVSGATVTFSPVEAGKPPAFGFTDAQGAFALTTYDFGDGAPEGEYKVMITKQAPGASSTNTSAPAHDPTGKAPASHAKSSAKGGGAGDSEIPSKYTNHETPLKKSVTSSGPQTIDIQIEK